MRRTHFLFLGLLVCLGSLGVMTSLRAQQAPTKRPSVLHEYFDPSDLDTSGSSDQQPTRTSSRTPGAPPALSLTARENEQIMKSDGPISNQPSTNPQGGLDPQNASNTLDDETDRVDQLNYFSSFDPSVIPFKRAVSQNVVALTSQGDYAFRLEPGRRRVVDLSNRPKAEDEDEFWGTFLVNSTGDARIPVPSVAPSQRVLQLLTEPVVTVTVERDEADNFTLRTPYKGLLRVNMRLAVPVTYFDGAFREDVSWGQLDRQAITPIPVTARQRAATVLAAIGITRQTHSPHQALERLVAYFRGFEGRAFPPELRGEDVYESIALNQIGVCRHRSFAFVMTASALGLPSRYIYNEAHAFVEVHWPGLGWRRIDLGGAAQDVLMQAAQNAQRVHDGGTQDPLPKPPSYTEEIARLARRDDQAASEEGPAGVSPGKGGTEDGPVSTDPNAPAPTGELDPNQAFDPGQVNAALNAPSDPESWSVPQDDRTDATLTLRAFRSVARRGDVVQVSGRLSARDQDAVLEGREIRVVLVPVGAPASALGARVDVKVSTRQGGQFRGQLELPKDLPIGRWTLRAMWAGDKQLKPAQAE